MDPVYKEFGNRLREARESAELRQETIAERVGLSRASIANIEAARQRFPFHIAYALAEAVNVPLTDLLPPERPTHEESPIPERLLRSVEEPEREWVRSLLSEAATTDG